MLEFYLLNPKTKRKEATPVERPNKLQVAIAGRVLEGQTKKAISGAMVKIQEMPPKFRAILSLKKLQYGSQWKKMSDRPDRQITASDGSFYFCNLPPGKYTLAAFLPGSETRYENNTVTVDISEPEKINVKIYDPKEINVEKSDIYNEDIEIIPTEILDIFLSPTGIKGTITGENNQPIVNAKVHIQGSRESTFTNKKGEYQLFGLLASKSDKDKYTIIVSANGYQKENSEPLELKQGKVINQNFSLKKRNPKLS